MFNKERYDYWYAHYRAKGYAVGTADAYAYYQCIQERDWLKDA